MKQLLSLTLFAFLFCFMAGSLQAQSVESKTQTYNSGSGTWTAPAGTWKVTKLEAWGGGGGGGRISNQNRAVGSGGGGGAYQYVENISATPGTTVTYSVGAGGSGVNTVTDGNASTAILGIHNLNAAGGKKGSTATRPSSNGVTNTAQGGAGGYTGGNGGLATVIRNSSTSTTVSASGAGGAGQNGGAGGASVTNNYGAGSNGTAPGGGGSGARNSSSINRTQNGGNGAAGRVTISYEILTLTVSFDVNYTGGSNPANQTVLYYSTYGTLPTVSRDNYIFLGWFTDVMGGTRVNADDQCTYTQDVTLYAHWAYAGAITTTTSTVEPCGAFTVSQEAAHTYDGTVTYTWKYTVDGGDEVVLNANVDVLTQNDLQLNQMGTYVITRYVSAEGQTVPSEGAYTIAVQQLNSAGAIETGTGITCSASEYIIKNLEKATTDYTTPIVYEWRYIKDGGDDEVTISGSNRDSLTISGLEAGTYVIKRYAALGCAVPQVSAGSYTLVVADLPASYDVPAANYTNFCKGGVLEVTAGDYNLTDINIAPVYRIPTSFAWMISWNGGTPEMAGENANYNQVLDYVGDYAIYGDIIYFGDNACHVTTGVLNVNAIADPTMGTPTLSATTVCPSGSVDITSPTIDGGVGDGYVCNWEFLADGETEWVAISDAEATYSSTTGTSITASNFKSTGNVQYRSYVSNPQGCDAYSNPAGFEVVAVEIPVVTTAQDVCPAPGDTMFTTMVTKTDDSFDLLWYADETSTMAIPAPNANLNNEDTITYYVAQYNPDNQCTSARVPVTLTITYTAHLGHESGELDQVICQNSDMTPVTFTHSGDCAPQIKFSPSQPNGVTIDNSVHGQTTISGTITEVGVFAYEVVLQPNDTTVCAAQNSFDGSISVTAVYNVTENKSICGGSYTISDQKGHSYTFTESGNYTQTLEAVTGCDSVVTLNLYVHEWNQFGFDENDSLIAGWTSFNNVASPIAADVPGSVSGSRITYSGWNGSNASRDNLSSTSSLVSGSGNSLGLINQSGTTSLTSNNGKSIVISTSTKDFGNLKLHFDYGAERYRSVTTIYSDNDKAFTDIAYTFSTPSGNGTLSSTHIELEQSTLTTGSVNIDLSASEDLRTLIENQDNITITLTFSGGDRSSAIIPAQYFRIDNICISGEKIKTLKVTGESQSCTNQSATLMATPPYINTNVNPNVTTPVIYKWERIVGGVSTVLEETSFLLTDDNVQPGTNKYVVSVGEGPCGQSDTIDVLGIVPAYRLDIERHGYVCSNEVDQVSNIHFTDEYESVDGMFIVYPEADAMRTPRLYECQLSIPSTTNPCDSIITLWLDVRKAFDTTVVANICLGETYSEYGFDITPIEEGVTYYTSDPTWTCSTGCDSVYRLTLITSSVQQTLRSENNVTLAAWPMDNGINRFVPACGVRTASSSFMVYGGENTPTFANTAGHAPSSDYCYTGASSNGGLNWPNLASSCSGFLGGASYINFSGAFFEITINPYDYENLKLKFDYLRENASTNNAQAFNRVNYYYKFSETGSYTLLGSVNINSTNWASQTLDFSSADAIDQNVMYLKVEFLGGNAGATQSCGIVNGSRYLPSYITVDNVMISGDRPARAHLEATAQPCDKTYVCEGEEVTFTCQGDDAYFKFYVVDETTNEVTPFDGATSMTITPTQTTNYVIKAVDQTTMCDSVWGPFKVEVVKNPTITYLSGSDDAGVCGNSVFDVKIAVENATDYTFTWLPVGASTPNGVVFNDDNNGNITISGSLTDGGSARYDITANPDSRCSTTDVFVIGTLATRVNPQIVQTIGNDTVCQGADMQFVISNIDDLNFALIDNERRYSWTTATETLSIKDTLEYMADEEHHSTRHYLTVNQSGCITVDSFDIVVYNFDVDSLRLNRSHYVLNYGCSYLDKDSLVLPDLMHNGEAVDTSMIASWNIRFNTDDKIYVAGINNLTATIMWEVTDICGNVHSKQQDLTFELPPCGDNEHYTVTDVDGNVYSTVRMGWNCWTRENMKALNYADGTPVAVALGYENNQFRNPDATAVIFGRLYSWYSAMNIPENATTLPETNTFGHVQGVCPEGWFVPTPNHYLELRSYDMYHLRTNTYWLDNGGDNSTQFSILPAGCYNSGIDRYENILGNAYFWSGDLSASSLLKSFMADCNCYMFQQLDNSPNNAFSVRCVKERE